MFECSFDANPVMYDGIRWAKMAKANDEEVSLSPAASSRISIDWDDNGGNRVTSRLIIRNVTVQDAGKIFCLVSNGYGKEAKEERVAKITDSILDSFNSKRGQKVSTLTAK